MLSSFPRYTSSDPKKGTPPKQENHPGKCKYIPDEEFDEELDGELKFIQSYPQMEKQVLELTIIYID